MEGKLDPVVNKRISHLADCFLYSSECISTDMAMEADKLDLNERYSRALKACHDVAFYLSYSFRDFSGTSATRGGKTRPVSGREAQRGGQGFAEAFGRPRPREQPNVQEVRRGGV